MAAYIIADLEVTHAETFQEYRLQVPALIEKYGGRYLARGGAVEVLEGSWRPARAVIVEFPDMAALKRFWDAPEYQPLRAIRVRSTRGHLIAVEGVAR
ncbi:MAG TPA: DUF1330 domain-containing protein [Candidatus Polarisedimenticolaceae bacterium]|nr:DUF1330 domain-containing protein [Candidatus Polarisedimenticolaceae bacterium]